MKIKICLLIGLPAAGKTSLGNYLKSYFTKHYTNIHTLVISYDELMPENILMESQLRNEVVGDEVKLDTTQGIFHTTWKGYRNNIFKLIQNIICYLNGSNSILLSNSSTYFDLCTCFSQKYLVLGDEMQHLIVVDDNMYYHSMRYCFYQLAREMECSFCQIFLDCEVNLLIQRNKSRNLQMVTEETILKMAELIEKPDQDKHPWEKNSIILLSINEFTDEGLETLIEFIKDHRSHLIPISHDDVDNEQMALDREVCLKSVVHQGDQLLRKLISEKMENEKLWTKDKKILQNFGKKLNEQRKTYLDILREFALSEKDIETDEGLLSEEFKEKLIVHFNAYTQ